MATHPIWGVGLLGQTPTFLLVLAQSGYARIVQHQFTAEQTNLPNPGAATKPVWSRVTDGTPPFTSLTPHLISGYSGASTMDPRTAYAVDPTFPAEEPDYSIEVRDGIAIKTSYPVGAGPVVSADCFLGVRATCNADTEWHGTIQWEEL
jgi:hypothetical protein